MSKRVFINGVTIGRDVSLVDIYHTSITGSNLLASSVSKDTLLSGSSFIVDDDVVEFIVVCSDGDVCQDETGSISLTTYNPNIRYFNVGSTDTEATVEITYPVVDGPTTGSLTQIVDFKTYSSFIIEADTVPAYPRLTGFSGWYDAPTSGNLISTNNPLTITQTTFTGSRGDEFYAYFS